MKTKQESLIETLETLLFSIDPNRAATVDFLEVHRYLMHVKDCVEAALDLIQHNREAGIIP